MDAAREGNCCIARYSSAYNNISSSVDTIMRRFRPIAPKPTSAGSNNIVATSTNIRTRRAKRKANNLATKSNHRKKAAATTTTTTPTLPLLPERTDNDSPSSGSSSNNNNNNNSSSSSDLAIWWNFGGGDDEDEDQVTKTVQVMMPRPVRFAGSIVTVECVTETWGGGGGGGGGGGDDTALLYGQLGSTDVEKMMKLEMDACPGFISDGGGDTVVWTNRAYRDMVGQHAEDEIKVWLTVKEKGCVLASYGMAFSCRVRMQYTRGGKEKCSLTLPCDVWRMECGGYAWRLDVNAALSLGR